MAEASQEQLAPLLVPWWEQEYGLVLMAEASQDQLAPLLVPWWDLDGLLSPSVTVRVDGEKEKKYDS